MGQKFILNIQILNEQNHQGKIIFRKRLKKTFFTVNSVNVIRGMLRNVCLTDSRTVKTVLPQEQENSENSLIMNIF